MKRREAGEATGAASPEETGDDGEEPWPADPKPIRENEVFYGDKRRRRR